MGKVEGWYQTDSRSKHRREWISADDANSLSGDWGCWRPVCTSAICRSLRESERSWQERSRAERVMAVGNRSREGSTLPILSPTFWPLPYSFENRNVPKLACLHTDTQYAAGLTVGTLVSALVLLLSTTRTSCIGLLSRRETPSARTRTPKRHPTPSRRQFKDPPK